MLKAMDSVTSYRRHMTNDSENQHDEMDVEVVCPGRSHYRTTRNGRVGYDNYYIEGSQIYFSKGEWKVSQTNWKTAPGCPGDIYNNFGPGTNNVVSGRDYLSLVRLTGDPSHVKLTRGGTETVDDVLCQIWEASFKGNFDVSYHVQFFVGSDDNLPRRILIDSPGDQIEIRYSDWNSPLVTVSSPT